MRKQASLCDVVMKIIKKIMTLGGRVVTIHYYYLLFTLFLLLLLPDNIGRVLFRLANAIPML